MSKKNNLERDQLQELIDDPEFVNLAIENAIRRRIVGRPETVPDARQDTWLKLLEARKRGLPIRKPLAYIRALARNQGTDLVRGESRIIYLDPQEIDIQLERAQQEDRIDSHSTVSQNSLDCPGTLEILPAYNILDTLLPGNEQGVRLRLVLRLLMKGMLQKQIAEVLGVGPPAISKLVFRLKCMIHRIEADFERIQERLTPRGREIIERIAAGESRAEIAEALSIERSVVHMECQEIRQELLSMILVRERGDDDGEGGSPGRASARKSALKIVEGTK